MSSVEERLARLEANYDHLTKQVETMDGKVDRLLQMASVSKGAFVASLRWGAVAMGLLGGAAWLWDRLPKGH